MARGSLGRQQSDRAVRLRRASGGMRGHAGAYARMRAWTRTPPPPHAMAPIRSRCGRTGALVRIVFRELPHHRPIWEAAHVLGERARVPAGLAVAQHVGHLRRLHLPLRSQVLRTHTRERTSGRLAGAAGTRPGPRARPPRRRARLHAPAEGCPRGRRPSHCVGNSRCGNSALWSPSWPPQRQRQRRAPKRHRARQATGTTAGSNAFPWLV